MNRDENWLMARKNRYHGLQPLRNALHSVGDPHMAMPFVHVCGTNGKGSTSFFLMNILMANGLKCGLFTSPHLVTHRDRMRIGETIIPREDFTRLLEQTGDLIEKHDLGMFEADVLIALLWFREMKCDIAVIEAGLGGRLDNTNVIQDPLLSIITTVGLDHMNVLGERIQQIAFEKAGIIRNNGRVLVGNVDHCAKAVVFRHAWRKHAQCIQAMPYRDLGENLFAFDHDVYRVQGALYQKQNASLALQGAKLLGVDIHGDATHIALGKAKWAGRFEKVAENPDIYLDGAHNPEGVAALCRTLDTLDNPCVVFGALRDKPGRAMAQMLADHCAELIVTGFEAERADVPMDLMVKGARLVPDCLEAVRVASQRHRCVVACGSLYLVSELRYRLMGETN